MNENEIRARVRDALGESSYPDALTTRVAGRMREPRTASSPRAMGFVAAVLALLIVGTLVFVRMQSGTTPQPAIPFGSPGPVNPNAQLPAADLTPANLGGAAADLVTPFNIAAQSSGRTVTLIGAYADTARTVLFFRTMPAGAFGAVQVADQEGPMNFGGSGGVGVAGDLYTVVDGGPHVGADGLAHLTVNMFDIGQEPTAAHQSGSWNFALALRVQPSVQLALIPALTSLGPWKVTVVAEVTPAVIHLRAVIEGLAPTPGGDSKVTLFDAAGAPLTPSSGTVELSQGGSRIDNIWPRPSHAATYQLVISAGVHEYRGAVAVPDLPPAKARKGQPIDPQTFPVFAQAIDLQGAFTTSVVSGFTNQCGFGAGPDGSVFVFGTWFKASDDNWYWIGFSTITSVRQYSGPGTYTARADVIPYAPFGADPIFAGTVQLTVTSDKRVDTGSVRGTLTWTGNSAQSFLDTIGGDWTCTPSPELGPG